MRICAIFLSTAAMTACATAESPSISEPQEFQIDLQRGVEEGQPTLLVTVTNASERALCFPADIVRNSISYGMAIALRDAKGRDIDFQEAGFIPPPVPGFIRLEPGASERGKYYLDTRFKLPKANEATPGMRARARFAYSHCDSEVYQFSADSGWRDI